MDKGTEHQEAVGRASGAETSKSHRIALMVGVIPLFMLGLAFAAVPLYDLFCRVTGFGGQPMIAKSNENESAFQRTILVRFDANVARDLGWSFAPEVRILETPIGQTQTVFYQVHNTSENSNTGIATFNVEPASVAPYFMKLECFCFEEMTLAANEEMSSAVMFFIDPGILDEPALDGLNNITLSYTFFQAKP